MEFTLFLIVYYLLASLVVGYAGSTRKIGFALGFIFSLLLTPLLGLVIVAFSQSEKEHHKYLEEISEAQKAIFREDLVTAKSHFLNALWHLDNDYKSLDQTLTSARTYVLMELKKF